MAKIEVGKLWRGLYQFRSGDVACLEAVFVWAVSDKAALLFKSLWRFLVMAHFGVFVWLLLCSSLIWMFLFLIFFSHSTLVGCSPSMYPYRVSLTKSLLSIKKKIRVALVC